MSDEDLTTFDGRVVAATDGSEGSLRAAEWAAGRARAHGVGLSIVRVTHLHPMPSRFGAYRAASEGRDFAGHIWQRAQERLDTTVAEIRAAHPDVDVVGELVKAESVAATLAEISGHAMILAVGRTGESAVNRLLLGGTVAAVVQHATGPVVVVPARTRTPDGSVVVGLDEDPTGERDRDVVEAAIREARALGVGLVAAHGWWFPEIGQAFPEVEELEREYDLMLAERTAGAGVDVTRVVRHNQPQHLLVDLSAEASLVVVGSRGRGGFPGLLLGSVSRSVIARAACPVMVVHS